MKICPILLVGLLSCRCVFAGDSVTNISFPIGAKEAGKFYDRTMTVTGKVMQVTIRSKVIFINLDEAFPNSPFTGVIFSANTNQFKDLRKLRGQNVEITGKIKNYQDKPEIVMTNASQLKIDARDAAK